MRISVFMISHNTFVRDLILIYKDYTPIVNFDQFLQVIFFDDKGTPLQCNVFVFLPLLVSKT